MVGSHLVPDALRRSLITKFVTTLVVLGLLVALVGYVATDQIRSQTKENVEREFQGLAKSQATLVSEWAQRNRLSTQHISKKETWRESTGGMQAALNEEEAGLPSDVTGLYVVNVSGQRPAVLSSSTGVSELPSSLQTWLKDREYGSIDSVRLTTPYESNDENVMAFVSPVDGEENRVFVMEVDLEPLSESVQAGGSDKGLVRVVDDENRIIASRTGSDAQSGAIGSTYASGAALEPVQQARNLTGASAGVSDRLPGTSAVIDEPYTAGYAPIPGTSWVVVVHSPRAELFGFVQQISTFGMLATGGLVVLVVLVGAGLGLHVTRSVNRLAGKATEMGEGNLAVDFSTGRIDEIGDLYQSFGTMRTEVRQRILDAEEARDVAQEARDEKREVKDEVREIANHLERKATEYSRVMRQCADGDLTQRLDPQSHSKDMTEIGESFNEMIAELEAAIDQVGDFAAEVEDGSQLVVDSAESVSQASHEVAESMQQISEANQEQKERLEQFAEELHSVAETLESLPDDQLNPEVRDELDTITSLCDELDELSAFSEETLAEVENVAAAAEEQTAALNEVSHSATELHEYAGPLGTKLREFDTDAANEFHFVGGSTPDDD